MLAWVGLGPVFLFSLVARFPPLVYAHFSMWVAGVLLDFYTTYRFYSRDPENFERNELSWYVRRLYRVLGFKAGLFAFLVLVELPVAMTVSFVLIPASAPVFGLTEPEALTCLASGLAFHGLMHLSAAAWNTYWERKKPLP